VSTRTAASRPTILLAALSALALSLLWVMSPVLASHDTDLELVAINMENTDECDAFDFAFKLDDVTNLAAGEYTASDADHTVFIEIELIDTDPPDGEIDDFTILDADPPIADIEVKQPNEGGGISHLTFCYETEQSVAESEEESVPESEEQSVPESEEQSLAESGEQSVKISTGTPGESIEESALFGVGSYPLATIAFSLILLASLGTLAYANVKSVRSRI
jgi:hypothetical protein